MYNRWKQWNASLNIIQPNQTDICSSCMLLSEIGGANTHMHRMSADIKHTWWRSEYISLCDLPHTYLFMHVWQGCGELLITPFWSAVVSIHVVSLWMAFAVFLLFSPFYLSKNNVINDPFKVWNCNRFDSLSSLTATVEMFWLFCAGGVWDWAAGRCL